MSRIGLYTYDNDSQVGEEIECSVTGNSSILIVYWDRTLTTVPSMQTDCKHLL